MNLNDVFQFALRRVDHGDSVTPFNITVLRDYALVELGRYECVYTLNPFEKLHYLDFLNEAAYEPYNIKIVFHGNTFIYKRRNGYKVYEVTDTGTNVYNIIGFPDNVKINSYVGNDVFYGTDTVNNTIVRFRIISSGISLPSVKNVPKVTYIYIPYEVINRVSKFICIRKKSNDDILYPSHPVSTREGEAIINVNKKSITIRIEYEQHTYNISKHVPIIRNVRCTILNDVEMVTINYSCNGNAYVLQYRVNKPSADIGRLTYIRHMPSDGDTVILTEQCCVSIKSNSILVSYGHGQQRQDLYYTFVHRVVKFITTSCNRLHFATNGSAGRNTFTIALNPVPRVE
jgi:hypothetical protein